jgi:hypothetical protein
VAVKAATAATAAHGIYLRKSRRRYHYKNEPATSAIQVGSWIKAQGNVNNGSTTHRKVIAFNHSVSASDTDYTIRISHHSSSFPLLPFPWETSSLSLQGTSFSSRGLGP